MRFRDRDRDRGAGTIVVLGIASATVALTGLLLPVTAVSIARHRAVTAADAAALAAADVLVGIDVGDPCVLAGAVAMADGVTLERCVPDGLVVTVRVRVAEGLVPVEASATAGPPSG